MVTRPRWGDERGLTLVELLVTMTLMSIVLATVTGTVILLQRTVNATDQRFDDLGQARVAMDALGRSVRTAVRLNADGSPFTVATGTEVELYANLHVAGSGHPKLLRLWVEDGELRERTTDGEIYQDTDPEDASRVINAWRPTGPPRERVLARGVSTTEPLFTFFAADQTEPLQCTPSGGEAPECLYDGTPLAEDLQPSVKQVRVHVEIQQAPDLPDVRSTVLENRIRMPNLYYVDPDEADFEEE